MPIIETHPTAEHGKKDARRHREKQKEALREALPAIIAEEAIITKKRGKTFRIPIKLLEIPHFRPKRQEGGGGIGVGQGPGGVGDVIGRKPGAQGQQPGSAGQEPGQDYVETEVDFAELRDLLFEDLGLPNLQEKTKAELEVALGFKITGISRSGTWALLNLRATAKEGIKRFWIYLRHLEAETGRDELTCFTALKKADGILQDALALLSDPAFTTDAEQIELFPIIETEDLRFWKPQEEKKRQSNATVLAMIDASGSMTTMKKYLARSLLFWLVEALEVIYERVEIRFIVHHTEARLVPEEEFFHTVESGGTYCYTAYELANDLIEREYPTAQWNVYGFHFSDGEDFDPKRTTEEIQKLFAKEINMLGYGEIHIDGAGRGQHQLLDEMKQQFPITLQEIDGVTVYAGPKELPFLGVIIEGKEQLWPALRQYLRGDRWSQ